MSELNRAGALWWWLTTYEGIGSQVPSYVVGDEECDNEYHYGAPFFHELDACLQEGSS